jgi:hypothetical protein
LLAKEEEEKKRKRTGGGPGPPVAPGLGANPGGNIIVEGGRRVKNRKLF